MAADNTGEQTRDIRRVGVIGLGTMGAGIVEVFARAGLDVVGVDGSSELAERGRGFLEKSTGKQVKRGRLSEEDQQAILGRVTWTDSYGELAEADLVIEAVPERMEIKHAIFSRLDDVVREDAILASNTSSLSLTAIAAGTTHPERVVGMHFFNPAPVLKLVEVITTILTDDAVVETTRALAESLGKKPVVVRDRAGFVANALLLTYLARAIRTYETGHVSREDLDDAARLGIGLPMGPLTLADMIGLDVCKEVCDVLYDATKDPSAASPALLQQMVLAGRLGRKTGRGFYDYSDAADASAGTTAAAPEGAVAVLGASAAAQAAGELLTSLGRQVVRVEGPDAEADLSQVAAVVVAGPELWEDDEQIEDLEQLDAIEDAMEAYDEWVEQALDDAPAEALVIPADGSGTWMVVGEVEPARVVPVEMHAPTRGGSLVEVVAGPQSDSASVAGVRTLFSGEGVRAITSRDRAGRVVDALLLPHLNDAVRMLDSGYASAVDIDTAMTAGCGYPEGPFAIIDRLGADLVIEGLTLMHDETGDPSLVPSPLLAEHAQADRPFLG